MTLPTVRKHRIFKLKEISKIKLGILEYLRGDGKLCNLKKDRPSLYVNQRTLEKWRASDPLFDQAIYDLTGGATKKPQQEILRKRYSDTLLPDQCSAIIDKVCSALQRGVPLKVAAGFAGITIEQLASICDDNQAFNERVTVAIHSFEVFANQKLQTHYDKDWRAIAWHLERRRPHDYGETKSIRFSNATDDSAIKAVELNSEQQKELEKINEMIRQVESGE